MKNYEKPMVIINEELAEGVYAASGCWQWTVNVTGFQPREGVNEKEYQIDGLHIDPDKHLANFVIYVTFNQNVKVLSCGSSSAVASGNVVTITHNISTNNTEEKYGFPLKVEGLEGKALDLPTISQVCPN